MKTTTALIVTCLALGSLTAGCLGGIRENSAKRTARDAYARGPECPKASVKTELVRTVDHGSEFDYLAEVKATGCKEERHYLCGQKESAWACKPIEQDVKPTAASTPAAPAASAAPAAPETK